MKYPLFCIPVLFPLSWIMRCNVLFIVDNIKIYDCEPNTWCNLKSNMKIYKFSFLSIDLVMFIWMHIVIYLCQIFRTAAPFSLLHFPTCISLICISQCIHFLFPLQKFFFSVKYKLDLNDYRPLLFRCILSFVVFCLF